MERPAGFRDVVIVADMILDETPSDEVDLRRDLEQTDPKTLARLLEAVASLGLQSHVYGSPSELARHADRHKGDIVLTLFGGRASRSRMALVPAVCESFGIPFIGPDAFGRIVAQDKSISKRLAVDSGLRTPDWRVVRRDEDLAYALGVEQPVVVKPLLEGSSIGISQRNRCRSPEETHTIGAALLADFGPLIVEKFIPGREVAFTRIEGADLAAWSEVVIEGDDAYFHERLFDAREKMIRDPRRDIRNVDHLVAPSDREAVDAFLDCFGHYGYCRVDGRLSDGRFHFIEFTPDAWIGAQGQLAKSFTNKGRTYEDVIAAILASRDQGLPDR